MQSLIRIMTGEGGKKCITVKEKDDRLSSWDGPVFLFNFFFFVAFVCMARKILQVNYYASVWVNI